MNPSNTIILGVLGEVPYAEFKGDVGVPYCTNSSHFENKGCLYYNALNFYTPELERETLNLDFDSFDKEVIDTVL